MIGRKPVINDGYFVQNIHIRRNILSNSNSILLSLIKRGEVYIAGRCNGFYDLIKQQRLARVDSFLKLHDSICEKFSKLDDMLGCAGRISGPDSLSVWHGFYDKILDFSARPFKDLGLGHEVDERDLKQLRERFINGGEENGLKRPPSRTEWERELEKMCVEKKLSMGDFTKRSLMVFANELYHYNFSQQLSYKSMAPVAVLTIHRPIFSELLDKKKNDLEKKEKSIPLIEIPRINFLRTEHALDLLLGDSNVGKSRKIFVKCLEGYLCSQTAGTVLDLIDAANEYNHWIKKEIGLDREVHMAVAPCFLILKAISQGMPLGEIAGFFLEWTPPIGESTLSAGIESEGRQINFLDRKPVACPVKT